MRKGNCLYFHTIANSFLIRNFASCTSTYCRLRHVEKSFFCCDTYLTFSLNDVEEAECKVVFRVLKQYLPRLRHALRIPANFKLEQRSICDGMECLCMLLRRVWYPCRYSGIIPRFGGRPVPREGASLDNCFGFVDGTVRSICRPRENQRLVYNGY